MNRTHFTPIAAAVAIGLGISTAATADVMGSSVLLVHDAQLIYVNATGGERTFLLGGPNSDFSALTGNNNAEVAASLDSIAGSDGSDEPAGGTGPIDLVQASQGTPPALAENNFTGMTNPDDPRTATEPSMTNPIGDSTLVDITMNPPGNPVAGGADMTVPAQNFAYSDQLLSGAIVDIDVDNDGTADVTGGADASQRADSGIVTTDAGSAAADTGAGFTFEFVLASDATVRFDALLSAISKSGFLTMRCRSHPPRRVPHSSSISSTTKVFLYMTILPRRRKRRALVSPEISRVPRAIQA